MASLFDAFSFDMLQAMVQEMNFWNETPKDVLNWMNVRLGKEEGRKDTYHVKELMVGGKDVTPSLLRTSWTGSPATADFVELKYWKKFGLFGMSMQSQDVYFMPAEHLVRGNITSGEFVFEEKSRKSSAVLVRYSNTDPFDMASRLSV